MGKLPKLLAVVGAAVAGLIVWLANGSVIPVVLGTLIGGFAGFVVGNLITDRGKVGDSKPARKPTAAPNPDELNRPIRESMKSLVGVNIAARLETLDGDLVAECEKIIDALRPLVEDLFKRHPDEEMTSVMHQVATSSLPQVVSNYAAFGAADRQAQHDKVLETLATIAEEVTQATEQVRLGRVTEFGTKSTLINELGIHREAKPIVPGSPGAPGLPGSEKRGLDEQFEAIRTLTGTIPAADRYKHTIMDLKVGGFIHWKGEVWKVEELNVYREGEWSWTELRLFSLTSGQQTWIEWEKDDEVEVSETVRQLRWSDLRDDEGGDLDDDDLEDLVNERDSVFLDGVEFELEEDCDVQFHRHGGPDSEEVWIVDFLAADGRGISIEEWDGGQSVGDYELCLWQETDPDAIEVLTTGD